MRKFYLVRGKKGILVGDPWKPHGFIGQRKLPVRDGEKMAKRSADRYEPCLAVIPKHLHVRKPLMNGQLEVVKEFMAESIKEAFAVREAAIAAEARPAEGKGDDK